MQPSEVFRASRWFRIRSAVMVATLTVATIHTSSPRPSHGPEPGILADASSTTARLRIADAYGRQPLAFEANRGQSDADVQFVSRGSGYTLFLTATEAVLALRKASSADERTPATLLRMKLVDSNPAPRVSQDDELPEKSHYIVGSDRRNWRTDIPRYAKVNYHDVYPGIDLVYYGNQRQLEYDFIVAPGADPAGIELAFEGAQDIHIDDDGDLLLAMGESEVRLETPLIYQETGGHRVEIAGGYRKAGSDRIAFNVGPYDSTKPLIVDPILMYSTYLGGSSHDFALGIATDEQGIPYITGFTTSVDFPVSGARQPACAGDAGDASHPCEDAFITKIGSYSTYLGGTAGDMATGIAVRPDTGDVYVTGWTRSPDFPTANAIDAVFGDDPSRERAFAARLSADGSELLYSTYLGSDGSSDRANAIAIDSDGAAYVAGSARDWVNAPSDVFVTKLTPDGSALAYFNRFGGSEDDVAYGIAVDDQGYAVVTGATESHDFPQIGSPRPFSGGFAARLAPDGSAFVYSSYVFGTGTGIAIAGPFTYVTGVMPGRQYGEFSPAGPGGGATDAFVEVLGFAGQPGNLTHLGGSGEDRGSTIGVDFAGNIWVTGVTASTDFPLVNPLQGQVRGLDTFVVRLNANLEPVFSTYLGGSGDEQLTGDTADVPWPPGPAIAVDRLGSMTYPLGRPPAVSLAYIAGFTDSTDFPTNGFLPAVQPATNGPTNSFVAWIVDEGIPTKPDLAVTELNGPAGGIPAEVEPGATLYYLFEVTNKGPARAKDVTFLDKLPTGAIVSHVQLFTPPSPYPRACEQTAGWVVCRLWTLSEGESVFVRIDVMPTTVGAQINTAAVEDEGGSCPPATCLSNAFLDWFYGLNQDLIWGEDAGRDGNIDDNAVTTTTVVIPGSAGNRPPTADAGPDQTASAGATCRAVVTLDGTGSSDPDGDTLTYAWTIDNELPPPILFSPVDPSTGLVTGPTITGPVPPGVHTVTLTVSDGFGGTSSDTVVVTVRDVTAPTFGGVPAPVTIEQSSPSGATWALAMPTGLDNCSGAVTVSSNAPALFPPGATTVTFTAVDAAGNSATATTIVTVVDTVSPMLVTASPQARTYLHSDVLTVNVSATDAGSGLASGMPGARLDGAAVANGQSISLLTLALGAHSFVLTATDVAGNSLSQSVTFTIVATIDSLMESVNVFAVQNKIDDASTLKSLRAKLNDAKDLVQRGKKPAAIEKLQGFIDLVTSQRGRHITADAAQILIDDARSVIDTLR